MKKSIKYFGLSVISLLAFTNTINAATIEIGDATVTANSGKQEVSLEFKDADLSDYTKVEFEIGLSGTEQDLHVKMGTFSYIASYAEEIKFNGDKITIIDSKGLKPGKAGSIPFSTEEAFNRDFKITPTNVHFYKTDATTGEEVEYGVNGNIKVVSGAVKYQAPKSKDATLNTLSVSQGKLSPEFSKDTTEYKVTVADTISSIKIFATPAIKATVVGTGSKNLVMGKNTFELVVTAEDGETKNTYTIVVNRGLEDVPSAYLESLKINNIGAKMSPEFDKKNNKYTVDVTNDITELDLKYELEDANAEINIEGNEDFAEGKNKVIIKITASDNSDTQEYELTVNREEKKEEEETVVVPEEPTNKEEKKPKIWLIILIAGGSLLILGLVAFLLFRKKDKKKKEKDDIDFEENMPEHVETNDAKFDETITNMLRKDLYDDDRTSTFDRNDFNRETKNYVDDDMEKTKEFNFDLHIKK